MADKRPTRTGVTTCNMPKSATNILGHDEYEPVLVSPPDRECRHLYITVTSHPILISFDGGETDHLIVGAGENHIFSDVWIPPDTTIMAANENAGSAYTLLKLAVW